MRRKLGGQRWTQHNIGVSPQASRHLALIAHNEMKPALIDFVATHRDLLTGVPLVATGTTGALLQQETGLSLAKAVKSGPLGGDQAIGALIADAQVGAVIFFRDPLSPHPHHADIEALGRLCDVYDVPFATNPSTALAVLWLASGSMRAPSPERERQLLDHRTRAQNQPSHTSAVVERYKQRQAAVIGEGRSPAPLRRL